MGIAGGGAESKNILLLVLIYSFNFKKLFMKKYELYKPPLLDHSVSYRIYAPSMKNVLSELHTVQNLLSVCTAVQ